MSIYRQGSLERIKVFAYAQTSSYLQRLALTQTMKSVSLETSINYTLLIGIKNMSLKSISLQRITGVMDQLGMDYDISFKNQSGIKSVSMNIEQYKYSPAVERILQQGNKAVIQRYFH